MLQHITPGKPTVDPINAAGMPLQPLIEAATAGQPLEPVMDSIVRGYGFDNFTYTVSTDSHPDRETRAYVWSTLPREWVELYDKNAYVEVDPRITMTWGRTTPFIWDAATVGGDAKVRAYLDHAAQYGVRSGVTISFSDLRYPRCGTSFSSAISPVSEARNRRIMELLGELMMLSASFHEIFMTNVVTKGIPPAQLGAPLSPRERQCLQMAAHGMTSADIGIKLGIVERTANFHFSNILSKLDALNRHEAIAKAMRLGIIRLDL
jgi:LuxR family transcriptional activator of conjugal transfer of Ti plasmids